MRGERSRRIRTCPPSEGGGSDRRIEPFLQSAVSCSRPHNLCGAFARLCLCSLSLTRTRTHTYTRFALEQSMCADVLSRRARVDEDSPRYLQVMRRQKDKTVLQLLDGSKATARLQCPPEQRPSPMLAEPVPPDRRAAAQCSQRPRRCRATAPQSAMLCSCMRRADRRRSLA
jgi:hypothetical protein